MKLWIAKDEGGFIGLYRKKPIWKEGKGSSVKDWYNGDFMGLLDSNDFPEVTFENSPQMVEIKLVKE